MEAPLSEDLLRRCLELRDGLSPRLPDIDPGDLLLLLQSLLRPIGSGRSFFLRPLGGGGHVP